MQEFIGSVRKSIVFKPPGEEFAGLGGLMERIGSSIRKSRIGIFTKPPMHVIPSVDTPPRGATTPLLPLEEERLPPMEGVTEDEPPMVLDKDGTVLASKSMKYEHSKNEVDSLPPPIRWRKGELIGCGAFGRVHMGMNLDSGELLAVKEVSIAAKGASNKTQEYIMELEKEVNLLKNLSHPNIVRYLGTAREVDSLNILLEFVPGGSISSLLGKFGFFPESVIRMYTKQLLLGLEYLHSNKIMHRDIKGANILVDNKGCIKLADFGASKKVEALATITGAKSMKGTPYWMAPEVIVQSGHSYPADIWSVGCTVIEMATGKAPWSQQYQEVAALFYVGTTKSHPPIPDHLSHEAKDFLLKCYMMEPELRPTASELLKHPFVTGESQGHSTHMGSYGKQTTRNCSNGQKDINAVVDTRSPTIYSAQLSNQESLWQPVNFDDDMCRIDDDADDLVIGSFTKLTDNSLPFDCNHSFNPVSDPDDDKLCKFDGSPGLSKSRPEFSCSTTMEPTTRASCQIDYGSALGRGAIAPEDDDEETEAKIRAFLEEKALELKKLQTPLYDFYKSLNVMSSPSPLAVSNPETVSTNCNLPPKSRSPNKVGSRRFSTAIIAEVTSSPGCCPRQIPDSDDVNFQASLELKEGVDSQHEPHVPRLSEIQRKWKEELAEELERTRERMRQAGAAKGSSPKDRISNRLREKKRFASPGK